MNRGMTVAGVSAVASAALMLAMGCSKQEAHATAAPAPATPIDTKRVELGGKTWDPEWDKIVELALPPEMLSHQVPRDVRRFCPRFYEMKEEDKRAFWAYFFQALAGAEAGLSPTTNVRHTEPEVAVKDDVTKRMVRSEGLLQLTYMDAKRYGCDFDWEADRKLAEHDPAKTILQPENNLKCGILILDNQLIALKRPLLSRFSYWSTLQPGGPSYRVFLKQMANVPRVCRVAPVSERAAGSAPAGEGSKKPNTGSR